MYGFASVRLDTGELHDLRPLIRFRDDQRGEIRGRRDDRVKSEIGEPRPQSAVGKTGIDFSVQSINDFARGAARRAYSEPAARLEAWHKFRYGRQVRQEINPSFRC